MLSFFQNPDAAAQEPPFDAEVIKDVDAYGQLPVLASNFGDVDDLFYFTTIVIIVFFLLILGLVVYSVVRYRRKTLEQPPASTVTHNTQLEVIWTVIPLIIVMVIFAWGWKGSLAMTVAPAEAAQNEYKVQGSQWKWLITHPGDTVAVANEFWMVVDKPASFVMTSPDVLHSFFIPNMRIKRDLVPGSYNQVWFTPDKIGTYYLFCTEYCGKDHSQMVGKVHVVSPAAYAERPWDDWPEVDDPETTEADLIAAGKKIYQNQCVSCHNYDKPDKLVGPSFQNLWGKQESIIGMTETVTVDSTYLLESMREPNAKLVEGFAGGGMSPVGPDAVPDDYVTNYLIPFLRSLQSDEELKKVQ